MSLLTSRFNSNNHNLYFSKKELTKILNLYSSGVSSGSWKDYAMDFEKNNAFFYFFKHSNSTPECIVSKSVVKKKIILRNGYGQQIKVTNSKRLKVEEVPSGIYFLEVFTQEGRSFSKVVKK